MTSRKRFQSVGGESPALKKMDGYSDIRKAQEYETNNKLQYSIKYYKIGIKKLTTATLPIKNTKVKSSRMETIEKYRQRYLKLEIRLQKQANSKLRKKHAMASHTRNAKVIALEKEPAYDYIRKAQKAEKNQKYSKAIEVSAHESLHTCICTEIRF